MFRNDDPTAVATQPSDIAPTGSPPGFFFDGSPAAGQPGTIVTDWWLNQVQEELVAIVLAAKIALAKGTNNQVLAALKVLFGAGRLVGPPRAFSFTSPNAIQTYTPSAGANTAIIEIIGGGGGGGGAIGTTGNPGAASAGGGGGSGAYGKVEITGIAGSTFEVIVGGGGPGGNGSSGAAATPGAGSFFATATGGQLIEASGGTGGSTGQAVTSGQSTVTAAEGGGQLTVATAPYLTEIQYCAAPGLAGFVASGSSSPGSGGNSPYGQGGLGGNTGNGTVGQGCGAGGGGGGTQDNAGTSGGAGAPGYVLIWEYT